MSAYETGIVWSRIFIMNAAVKYQAQLIDTTNKQLNLVNLSHHSKKTNNMVSRILELFHAR